MKDRSQRREVAKEKETCLQFPAEEEVSHLERKRTSTWKPVRILVVGCIHDPMGRE